MNLSEANRLLDPGYLRTTEQYKWRHPKDHVWCEWIGERGTGRYIGGTHHVHGVHVDFGVPPLVP